MKTTVIIPAAGLGSRMGNQLKQLMLLDGKPVLSHTLEAFNSHKEIDEIVVVGPRSLRDITNKFEKVKALVEGGENRQASVWRGLCALDDDVDWVLIHDGARPLVSSRVISDVLASGVCAISGVKSKDTIKIADVNNIVEDTPDRDGVWLVQTPQSFPYHIIKKAHQQAIDDSFTGTDDASLVERLQIPVKMIAGDYRNIKLTTPEDILVAEAYIRGN